MSTDVIKSHFTLPLKKQRLTEGPKGDYTITVKIGGGKKSAIIKFQKPEHRDQMSATLEKVASDHEIELTLDIAA